MRLHDEVDVGTHLLKGPRVVKASEVAKELLRDRHFVVSSPTSAALGGLLLDLDFAAPDPGSAMGPTLRDVTVVTPVRDNPTGVDRLLTLLAKDLRCIVVDDASADSRVLDQVVQRHGATLLRLDRNVGPAASRDAGLRAVTTGLVAFIDSDVDVTPTALQDLARHFADPGLAAAAPRVRSRGGRRWFERYDDVRGSLDLGPTSATVRPWSAVSYLPSACLVARVDALGDGFDPHLRSGEDVDLVWRLRADGFRARHVAEVDVWHDARGTVRTWLGRKAFYGTSAAPLAARHGDQVAPAVMSPVAAVAASGLLLQRRWSLALAVCCGAWLAGDVATRLPDLLPSQRATILRSTAGGMVRQTSGLALRHWWPASLVLAAVSSRARRCLALMVVVDGLVAHRTTDTSLDPLRFTIARRADDMAYGAGVWWGAARERSVRCLVPRWLPPRRGRGTS